MISDELRAEIRRLYYAEHWKIGTISEQRGLHHETVRNAIATERFSWRGVVRPSALDPYLELVAETFRQYPRLTAKRLHEMLATRGYLGSVGQLRRRVRQLDLRPRKADEAFFRLTTAPGEQGQVDWGHFGRLRIGGSERPLYFFVVVLSPSTPMRCARP
jgi:transposase